MVPIPQKSTDKTIEAAKRVQTHLETGFDLPFSRAYRTQGSIMTNTHIKTSDFDLLTIIDAYRYLEEGIPRGSTYQGVPSDDIAELRSQSLEILKGIYSDVDDSNEKCISIVNKSLKRKVDVVFAFWYSTMDYVRTNLEFYRGIIFKPAQLPPDYPFAHIANVNDKGTQTLDGSRKGIRLLKSLKEDCEDELKEIKSFHLTSIVHSMNDQQLIYFPGNEILIASAISRHLDFLLNNAISRNLIKSPNTFEYPLADDKILPDMKRLKEDLDLVIEDASKDLQKSEVLRKAILSY